MTPLLIAADARREVQVRCSDSLGPLTRALTRVMVTRGQYSSRVTATEPVPSTGSHCTSHTWEGDAPTCGYQELPQVRTSMTAFAPPGLTTDGVRVTSRL